MRSGRCAGRAFPAQCPCLAPAELEESDGEGEALPELAAGGGSAADEEGERLACDWQAHPAEAILGLTKHGKVGGGG